MNKHEKIEAGDTKAHPRIKRIVTDTGIMGKQK